MNAALHYSFSLRQRVKMRNGVLGAVAFLMFVGVSGRADAEGADPRWVSMPNGFENQGVSAVALRTGTIPRLEHYSSKSLPEIPGLNWNPAVVDQDSRAYFGAADKNFYGVRVDGSKAWSYPLFDRPDAEIDSAAAFT